MLNLSVAIYIYIYNNGIGNDNNLVWDVGRQLAICSGSGITFILQRCTPHSLITIFIAVHNNILTNSQKTTSYIVNSVSLIS